MTAEVPGPEMEAGAFLLGSGRSQTVPVLAGPAGPQPPAPLVEAPSARGLPGSAGAASVIA